MRLNFRQEERLEEFVKEIEERFPDISFVEAVKSPDGESTLWLEFTRPATDDRFLEITEYASNRTMDFLEQYGRHMLVMPVAENGAETAQKHLDIHSQSS